MQLPSGCLWIHLSKQHRDGVLNDAVDKKKDARKFIEKLVSKISSTTLEYLIDDIENRVEDSTLHFRLDKEEFVRKKFILSEKNAVKIKIYTPIYSKKEIPQIFSDLLHPN